MTAIYISGEWRVDPPGRGLKRRLEQCTIQIVTLLEKPFTFPMRDLGNNGKGQPFPEGRIMRYSDINWSRFLAVLKSATHDVAKHFVEYLGPPPNNTSSSKLEWARLVAERCPGQLVTGFEQMGWYGIKDHT